MVRSATHDIDEPEELIEHIDPEYAVTGVSVCGATLVILADVHDEVNG